jgi:hypothetical protein
LPSSWSLDEPEKHRWGGAAAAPVFKNIAEQILYRGRSAHLPESACETDSGQMRDDVVKHADLTITEPSDESIIPDFRDMSMRNVLKLSQERGVDLKIVGSGWAERQRPSAGAPLKNHQSCTVFFSDGS